MSTYRPTKGAAQRSPTKAEVELDVRSMRESLQRVGDPVLRYFLCLFVDLATERMAQLESPPLGQEFLDTLKSLKN